MEGAGIYFLIKDNKVIYVGKTLVWPFRLKQHISQCMDFDNAKFLKYPFDELDKWEKAYIKKYKPENNMRHNPIVKKVKKKLYTFHVGSTAWKKRCHKMKFRKLTEKSIIGFGKYRERTVDYVINRNKHDLIGMYFNCSHITFFDNILEQLLISEEWRIQKPGTDKEKYYAFCEAVYPEWVDYKKRHFGMRVRKTAKMVLKNTSWEIGSKSRLMNDHRKL